MDKKTLKLLGQEYTYIKNCWTEFTRLSFEEMDNLRRMKKVTDTNFKKICKNDKKTKKKAIVCLETGKIFANVTEASKRFDVSHVNIIHCIKNGWRVKKVFTLQRI